MSNIDDNKKELQLFNNSLIDNHEKSEKLQNGFENNYEESGNTIEDFSDNYEEFGNTVGDYSSNNHKNFKNTKGNKPNTSCYSSNICRKPTEEESIVFLIVISMIFILFLLVLFSFRYIVNKSVQQKVDMIKTHPFITEDWHGLTNMSTDTLEELLQTASLDEVKVAISKLNKRLDDLKKFSKDANELLQKDKKELKIKLKFLQNQMESVEENLSFLIKKKAEKESSTK